MLILLDIPLWENPILYIIIVLAGIAGALAMRVFQIPALPTEEKEEDITQQESALKQLKIQNQSLYQQNQALQATISQQISHITKLENTLLQHDHTLIQALDSSKAEIMQKQRIIEKHSRDLLDSIIYARHIQTAMLPKTESIRNAFDDLFVFFRPRDIVSGDFYWFNSKNHRSIIAVVDCTGHGVPGAFLSMIGNDLLHKIVTFKGISEPDKILHQLHLEMRYTLRQKESGNEEGMDMTVCTIHQVPADMQDLFGKPRIEFAGAKNSLVYVQNGELKEIKGNKAPIGGYLYEEELDFTKHTIEISTPTTLYMFSDGYQDQFGGKDKRKFMVTRFRKLLLEIHQHTMVEQEKILSHTLDEWMNDHTQVDDILVMGIQIGQSLHTAQAETF
jgi:serine phosphatase RsbU (regulator of sigma subunit)